MINAFLLTMGIGLAVALTYFFIMLLNELVLVWRNLLEVAIIALRRYSTRNMVVRAYYDAESMKYVREWESPTPFYVEMVKKKNYE